MEEIAMPTPRADHPITLEPATRRWRACFNDHVIADTDDALVLREADYPAVIYFPRQDVGMEYMGRTDRHTHCPHKGDASYYTISMDGDVAENVAWSYEAPFEAMGPITGRIAFYTDRVEVYEVTDPRIASRHHGADIAERATIDTAIQHTDAGAGASQREHWPPTVELPDVGEGGGSLP
jgi:uncharacterized protein (DUF427 family)